MSWTELVGNAACLDFANSLDTRPEPSRDWLAEPAGLHAWAVHAGLVRHRRADGDAGLLAAARDLRDAVHQIFSAVAGGHRAPELALATLTATAAEGLAAASLTAAAAEAAEAATLTATAAAAAEAATLRAPAAPAGTVAGRAGRSEGAAGRSDGRDRPREGPGRGGSSYELVWAPADGDRQVLWAVADSALGLLRHGPLERIGECPSCGWLFLDTSRNGRRRWCSMAMCGNSVKSARHYARSAAQA